MDKKQRLIDVRTEIQEQENLLWELREKERKMAQEERAGELWEWGPDVRWLALFLQDGKVVNLTEMFVCECEDAQENIMKDPNATYIGHFDVEEV